MPGHQVHDQAEPQEREAKHSAGEIEVMANTMGSSPMHEGEEVERFADVSEHNEQQANTAEELQPSPDGRITPDHDDRPGDEQTD